MTKCETCGFEKWLVKYIASFDSAFKHNSKRSYSIAAERNLEDISLLTHVKRRHQELCKPTTKSAAITLLADEGFCKELSARFQQEFNSGYRGNLWHLYDRDKLPMNYWKDMIEQAIRKAANLEKEGKRWNKQ